MRNIRIPTAVLLKTVLLLTICLPLAGWDKCGSSRSEVLSYAENAVADTRDIVSIFAGIGKPTATISRALSIGDQLILAIKNNVTGGDAITLTSQFIDATEQIANEIDLFTDPGKKTFALAVLAGVRIALRRVASYMKPAEDAGVLRGAGPAVRSAAAKVREFSKSADWRCRSAQTGRFQKMEYCRQHPDVSTVERIRR